MPPQTILTIGPKTKRPSAGGKIACKSLMILGALAIGSLGKRMEINGFVLDAIPQNIQHHRSVDPDQTAHPSEGKTIAKLDGRELSGENKEQGEGFLAIWQLGGEDADCGNRYLIFDIQI